MRLAIADATATLLAVGVGVDDAAVSEASMLTLILFGMGCFAQAGEIPALFVDDFGGGEEGEDLAGGEAGWVNGYVADA